MPTNDAAVEALGFLVTGGLIASVVATVVLFRSGRTVEVPSIRWRPRARRDGDATGPSAREPRRPARDGDHLHHAARP